jgi:glycosyltransferase involved in cell wall biosynthesis
MNTPRISVIFPAYNAEAYIAEAIESILNQTFTDFELIILNDGSTDSTPDIIKKYADSDRRIVFVDNKKNRGLIAVLNQGLDMARGEYIARMDSDDISLPARFEKQVAYLDQNPDVGVLGTLIHGFGAVEASGIQIPVVTVFDLLRQNYIAHPSVMMRKSIIDKYELRYNPDYKHCEDMELWSRMILLTKFHNIMEVLLMYRISGNNISTQNWNYQQEMTEKIRQILRRRLAAAGMIKLDNLGFAQSEMAGAQKISLYD